MSAQIVITAGPDRGRSFFIEAGATFQVGRSQATATKLTDATVSRVHCEIEYDGHKAVLVNISPNGTTVNGKSLGQQELSPGDVVRVGGTEFRYQLAASEAPTAPPRPADLATLPGQTLSHYRIDSVIAKGATGVVFKAHDTRDDGVVALKVLQPEFSSNEEDMQRFVRAMKTGRPPFSGASLPELIGKIRSAEPEKPKKFQMSIPDLFQGTVMKLLAKAPEQRFQSATELLADLERVGKFAGVTV